VCGGLINRLLFLNFEPGDPTCGKPGLSDGPMDRAGFCLSSGPGWLLCQRALKELFPTRRIQGLLDLLGLARGIQFSSDGR
jgi:hypothetical protein